MEFPQDLEAQMDISSMATSPENRKWTGPFTFVVAADTQFGLIEKHILRKKNPRWDAEIQLSLAALAKINALEPKPRFLVICGDMLDTHPNSPEEILTRNEQYTDFVKVFSKLDPEIRLVVACGNHDVSDIPTGKTLDIYREQFGPDYFSFWVSGVKFTVLNSQLFKNPLNEVEEVVQKRTLEQEDFMRSIPDPTAVHQVVFQHLPYFVKSIDEEEVSYQNMIKKTRREKLDLLHSFGVSHVICGHLHRNAGGNYRGINQIITGTLGGPFGPDPSGIRLFYVTSDKIEHEYIPITPLE